jgi:uncharacterized YigZ family protein
VSRIERERDPAPPSDPYSYKTPRAAARSEIKERGSRFLAFLAPAGSEEDALAFLASLKKRYHDATHHCWAYRVGWGEGLKERCSDAGEPSRTAGPPILAALQASRISDAAAVVVRYFGGVKLGTAGLVRAYREAARAAVEDADLAERTLEESFEVEMPYSAQGSFRHALGRLGLEVGSEVFGETWGAALRVPLGKVPALEDALGALRESFKGDVRWKSK